MRILIATGLFPPDIGGPATYSKLLADELPKQGIEVNVLSFGSVRRLPKIIRHFVFFLKALKAGRTSDVIFAQDPLSVGLPAAMAAMVLSKKFILKIVGDYAWEQYQIKSADFKKLEDFQKEKFGLTAETRRSIQKWVAKKAKKIIVPSNYLKKIICEGWKMPEEKVAVIYNAVKQSNFNPPQTADRDFILSIGRLVPWKGLESLIEVIKELPAEIKLLIVGSGPQFNNLKEKVEKLNLADRVEIVAQVPYAQLPDYFAKARIFVLNSAYEGLPHIILEAMREGVPVITTNIGGNPEVIKNGESGILIEYGDKSQLKEAILRLWTDEGLRQKFINNSFRQLEKFSLDKMIKRTIEVLTS